MPSVKDRSFNFKFGFAFKKSLSPSACYQKYNSLFYLIFSLFSIWFSTNLPFLKVQGLLHISDAISGADCDGKTVSVAAEQWTHETISRMLLNGQIVLSIERLPILFNHLKSIIEIMTENTICVCVSYMRLEHSSYQQNRRLPAAGDVKQIAWFGPTANCSITSGFPSRLRNCYVNCAHETHILCFPPRTKTSTLRWAR